MKEREKTFIKGGKQNQNKERFFLFVCVHACVCVYVCVCMNVCVCVVKTFCYGVESERGAEDET